MVIIGVVCRINSTTTSRAMCMCQSLRGKCWQRQMLGRLETNLVRSHDVSTRRTPHTGGGSDESRCRHAMYDYHISESIMMSVFIGVRLRYWCASRKRTIQTFPREWDMLTWARLTWFSVRISWIASARTMSTAFVTLCAVDCGGHNCWLWWANVG